MQQPQEALLIWRYIEKNAPSFLHLIADKWIKASAELNQEEEGLKQLIPHLKDQGTGELLDIIYKHTLRILGAEKALELLNQVMLDTPSLTAMTKRFETEYQLAQANQDPALIAQTKASLDLLKHRTNSLARYTCSNCGFRARRYYWQCPGCNHWDVYSPKRSEGFVG